MSGTTSGTASGLFLIAPRQINPGDDTNPDPLPPIAVGGLPDGAEVSVTLSQGNNPVSISATGGAVVTQGAGNSVTVTGTVAAVNATLATLVPPSQSNTPDTVSLSATDGVVTTSASVAVALIGDDQLVLGAPSRLLLTGLTPVLLPASEIADYAYQEVRYNADFEQQPLLTVTVSAAHGTFFPGDLSTDPAVLFSGIGSGTLVITGGETVVRAALALLRYDGTATSDTIQIAVADGSGNALGSISIPVTVTAPPTGGTFTWTGPSGAPWQDAADWTENGTVAARAPNGGDAVTLGADTAAVTIIGPGAASSLSVVGSYVLGDAVQVSGALDVTGRLALNGNATDPAALSTASATVSGEVDLTTGTWTNTGALSLTGSSTLEVRNEAELVTGSLQVGADALLSVVSASSLAVTGTLTVGDGGGGTGASNGTAVLAGDLTAGSLVLQAGSGVLTKGIDTIGTLTVAQGALFGGASTVSGGTAGLTAITNDGTIDGPAGLVPLDLQASIAGTGQLVVDAGGGLELGGAVGSGQTVVFRPGVGPYSLLSDGSAGGLLQLDDVADFHGTLTGFAAGDVLAVVSATAIATATLTSGNVLRLQDANGNTLASLQLDPAASYAGMSFSVAQADSEQTVPNQAAYLVRVAPAGEAQATITTSGGAHVLSGLGGVVPLVSTRVTAGLPETGITYQTVLTVGSGVLSEVVSLPVLVNGLFDTGTATASAGDGSFTGEDSNGNEITEISVSGTGTQTLTISGSSLVLVNLQTALALYEATGGTGTEPITVTSSATGSGVNEGATATVDMQVVSAPVAYSWRTGGSQSGTDAANWIGSDGQPNVPGAGDPTTFGPGSYAVTGDISTGDLHVTGDTFLSGAIYATGALTVDGMGAASFGGALDVLGNVEVGQAGTGGLNVSGLINAVGGNLVVGAGAEGYLQTDALLDVAGDLVVGQGADGSVDIGSNTAPSNVLGGGQVLSGSADIGSGAGYTGTVVDDNALWVVSGALNVGLNGDGRLEIATATDSSDGSEIDAGTLTIGRHAGAAGRVSVTSQSTLQVQTGIVVGQDGAGTLLLTGSGIIRGQSNQGAPSLAIGADTGGNGTVLVQGGSLTASSVSVGGTAGASGGDGLLQVSGEAPNASYTVTGAGVTNAALYTPPNVTADSLRVWSGGTAEFDTGAKARFGTVTVDGTLRTAAGALGITTVQRTTADTTPGLVIDAGGTVTGAGNPALNAVGYGGALTAVQNAGTLDAEGGLLQLGTVSNAGTLDALSGGSLSVAILSNGGTVLAESGGAIDLPATSTITNPDGSSAATGLTNSGTFGTDGGAVTIEAAITSGSGGGTLAVGGGGTLTIGDGTKEFTTLSDSGETVRFGGAGRLVLDDDIFAASPGTSTRAATVAFASAVRGFGTGDAIDVTGYATAILGYANGILRLSDNRYEPSYATDLREIDLNVGGGYDASQFSFAQTANGAELTVTVACYCPGTAIATPDGERPIEALRIGDPVLTASGRVRPVRWIGRRSYDAAFASRNPDVLPVVFRPGSLGNGLPRRSLTVSPLHAMLLDGALVPAHLLVNGSSILQPAEPGTVRYLHLELEEHDILLAEGAPAESFVDDESRAMFHNAAEFAVLYPDHHPRPAAFCAPRLEGGEEVEAIRRRLRALADAAPGPALGGFLDTADGSRVTGWARNGQAGGVRLSILVDGVARGEVTADEFRHDLVRAGEGDGRRGFSFAIPGGLSPDRPHTVEVRRSADGVPLHGSPRLVPPDPARLRYALSAPPPSDRPLRSALDACTRDRIAGWAWEPGSDEPVAIQVLDNGAPLIRVLANAHRPDLRRHGIGTGRHGFDIVVPGGLSPLARHVLEIRRESDGAALEGSPVVLEAASSFDADLQGAVHRAVAALDEEEEGGRVLSFLLAQTERLLTRRAQADAEERRALTQFRRRWGRDGAGDGAKDGARDDGREDGAGHDTRPRALVIDAALPRPGHDAGSEALLSHMRALGMLGFRVDMVAADDMDAGSEALAEAGIGCMGRPLYASAEDVLRRNERGFALVYLHRGPIAARYLALARRHQPTARVVYSVADLHHLRLARQAVVQLAPALGEEARRAAVAECAAALAADAVLTHSDAEAAALRDAVPGARVHVVPWAVPVAPRAPRRAADRSGLAFIGNFAHAPNRDAAHVLVRTVMPLVWRHDPGIRCLLVGPDAPADVQALAGPRVDVTGRVPDLGALFGRIRLTVAPLRFGAGVKGKVLTSLAARTPCAMLPLAAEGMDLPAVLRPLVVPDAAALADTILRLHANPALCRSLGAAGARWVSAAWSDESVAAALRGAVHGQPAALDAAREA